MKTFKTFFNQKTHGTLAFTKKPNYKAHGRYNLNDSITSTSQAGIASVNLKQTIYLY
jgi:hypothetical protein